MRILRLFTAFVGCLMGSCNQAPKREAKENTSIASSSAVLPPTPRQAPRRTAGLKDEQFSYYRETTLLFGKYLVAHDEEDYASIFYKPYPDSAWVKIPQVRGRSVELDTANIDQQGEPELLLTIEYKRSGNPDYGTVRTLYVLRAGPAVDLLLAVRVECSDYHHARESGELHRFDQTQQVAAGYGFLRIGPMQTTCERSHSAAPCACDPADLADAGGVPFARPGRYRWQRGRLAWVGSR
jgi:hypothetical protein